MDIYDFVQRNQIRSTSNRVTSVANEVQHHARRTSEEIDALEERLERMRTMCEAMWQLVCESSGLTDAHLAYRVYELDVSDGDRDGRRASRATKCSSCEAMVSANLERCQFCGADAPPRAPWDMI